MSALIVVESYFGNTTHIAEIVADTLRSTGIEVDILNVGAAPTLLSIRTDLLVIGAPTHDLGMSTEETRQAACARNGHPLPGIGVREWIAKVQWAGTPPLVALFDTRTGFPWVAGSAASQASALLSGKGFPVMAARETFRVDGIYGPLLEGEDDRAHQWATAVAARLGRRRPIARVAVDHRQ